MQKNATSRDPTASSRSAIRRRRTIEVASTSSSNPFPTNRAQVGDYLNRRRRTQERQEVLSGLLESSRRRASDLERLANANETQLRASELREARQNLRTVTAENEASTMREAYSTQFGMGRDRAGRGDRVPYDDYGGPPRLQRRFERLPELSRDLPSPSDPTVPGMLGQTHELRDQIERLRDTLRRHQAVDATSRVRAAPWLEPDRQLHSNDLTNPLSALHENRTQLSSLRSLLSEIEREFRDPTPHDPEEQFRLSVRARYADNPAENPYHEAPHMGWDEDRISEFWNAELARRLLPTENSPVESAAHQVLSHRGYYVEGRRRDSLSPASSELSESSGGPVSASLSSPPRRVRGSRRSYVRAPPNPPMGWRNGPRPTPGASIGRFDRTGRTGEGPWRFGRRVVQSPPSYISAGGIDGLGDRELSLGPGDAEEEEAWEVMQTTVAPDHTLPSADSSFTSAAASASFSASRSHSAQSSVPTSFRGEDECLPGVDMFASD